MNRVIAYHIVLTCYGFWLPNDPRGSWSDFVRAFELYRAGGPATKVNTKRSVAKHAHDHAARELAKASLARPPVVLNGHQARTVMEGVGDYVSRNDRSVYAAAVMPDHVHLVVGRCEISAERLAEQFKARATMHLSRAGSHPFGDAPYANGRLPSPWARKAWSVFLDSPSAIQRAVRYVERNPTNAGHRPQRYDWVRAYTD